MVNLINQNMHKFSLTIKLLYRLLAIGFICLFANTNEISAAESMVRVMQNGILKGNLTMRFQAGTIFNDKVIRFLDKGFTIRVEYTIELWQSRGYWFDRLSDQQEISYQVDFDPLEKRYVCRRTHQNSSIATKADKQLDKIIQWITNSDLPVKMIPADQLDPDAKYYYNIGVLVATLTSENVKDLQKWMGEFKEESPSLAKTAFRIISDFISSRNHKKYFVRSEQFYSSELPILSK
jgi:hypothetical protein